MYTFLTCEIHIVVCIKMKCMLCIFTVSMINKLWISIELDLAFHNKKD